MKFFLFLLLALFACHPFQNHHVVAKVGDQSISTFALSLRVLQRTPTSSVATYESASAILESLIDEAVLANEAKARGITISNEAIAHKIRQRDASLDRKLLRSLQMRQHITDQHLEQLVRAQLLEAAYWRSLREEGTRFCDEESALHSLQNCVKRGEFMAKLRAKYRVSKDEKAVALALSTLSESAK